MKEHKRVIASLRDYLKKPQNFKVILTPSAQRDFAGLNKYIGLTYPCFLSWKIWRWLVLFWWKKFFCPKHIHLFDEVASSEHYLSCDACELAVHIAFVETSEEACDRAEKGLYIETSAIEKSEDCDTCCVQLKQE